jgi:hydrogenase-1 operon protein HyaF
VDAVSQTVTIPIVAVPTDSNWTAGRLHQDILGELAQSVNRLVTTGEKSVIDLRVRGQGLSPDEMQPLRTRLGKGEVSARFVGNGHIDIEETAYPGIWWMSYFDANAQLETQQIEVSWFPTLLKAQTPDVKKGAERLAVELAALAEQDVSLVAETD